MKARTAAAASSARAMAAPRADAGQEQRDFARDVGFYLDSGWPGDNYEVTMAMATTLISRGWRYGQNLLHLSFPNATHNEAAWGIRLHIPMQFFNGAVARASRKFHPVLGSDVSSVEGRRRNRSGLDEA